MRSRNVSTGLSCAVLPYLGMAVLSELDPGLIIYVIMIPNTTALTVVVAKYAMVLKPILPHVDASRPAIPAIKLDTTKGSINI